MWVVELSFSDAPERMEARAAHRVRLAALHESGVVKMAGPFGDGSGALIIFDVDVRDELDKLMAVDPYFTTPGVAVKTVRQWNPFLQ